MKLVLVQLFLVMFISLCSAQHPDLLWVESGDCLNDDQVLSTTFDKEGNVIVAGYFSGSLSLGNYTVSGQGGQDFFVAKYNSTGSCEWLISGGGSLNDQINGAVVDPYNDIIISGTFQSSSITVGSNTFNNSGSWDSFIAKIDQDGNILWSSHFSSSGHDNPTSLATDSSAVVVCGWFSGNLIIGNDTLFNYGSSGNKFDGYLVKFDTLGSPIWSRKVGGTETDNIQSVTIDNSNNIYCSGRFGNSDLYLDSITLFNKGPEEIFTAKYDESGNILWANAAGDLSVGTYSYGIDTDSDDNVIIGGYFFGYNMAVDTQVLQGNGGFLVDPFIIKYGKNGNVKWARSYGRTAGETFYNLKMDSDGNIYTSGSYDIWGDLLPTVFGNDSLFGFDQWDLMIIKMDSLGNPIWTVDAGGHDIEEYTANSLDINESTGTILFGGGYWSDSLFIDSTYLENNGISSSSSQDLFFGIYQEDTSSSSASTIEYQVSRLKIYPNPSAGTIIIKVTIYEDNQMNKINV